jgi:hypothetical protein
MPVSFVNEAPASLAVLYELALLFAIFINPYKFTANAA